MWFCPSHSWDKPAQPPLGRLTPPALQTNKQTKTLNNKQGTKNWHTAEGMGCCKHTREAGESKELISMQTFSKQRLERQKGWQQEGDKLLPEIGQVAIHKDHLLSQWATSKVKWHCKIEKYSANHHNTLTAGGQLTDHWPCFGKGDEAKKQAPSKPTQRNPTPKQDRWWATELISGTWGQHTNLNCQTLLRQELTKQLPLKEEKLVRLPNHLSRLKQSFCFNTNTRTGC
jgi:hypothetical protein